MSISDGDVEDLDDGKGKRSNHSSPREKDLQLQQEKEEIDKNRELIDKAKHEDPNAVITNFQNRTSNLKPQSP